METAEKRTGVEASQSRASPAGEDNNRSQELPKSGGHNKWRWAKILARVSVRGFLVYARVRGYDDEVIESIKRGLDKVPYLDIEDFETYDD